MNFPPIVRAWLMLITLAIGTGTGVGYTAFLSGAGPWGSFFCGLGTAMTNVYHALAASPKEKADAKTAEASAAPFAKSSNPTNP